MIGILKPTLQCNGSTAHNRRRRRRLQRQLHTKAALGLRRDIAQQTRGAEVRQFGAARGADEDVGPFDVSDGGKRKRRWNTAAKPQAGLTSPFERDFKPLIPGNAAA